ncbi:oxidoreductase [Achromobacter aloeverae]|uniref:2-dehydropantoate 2-reductase n=1 Tax=Achromobacter aloeverae TaxID=1750518 RepID=A0A4Q1HCV3_9BURK|nr:oxidoreductase [Achromobacter aloeverae]RXN83711.1 oxidoreductase [Achromobacter aloeverae]
MNEKTNADVAVLGPGAIGTTVAAALHEVGRTPLLCGRTPRDSLTLRDGDRLIVVPGPIRTDPARIARPVDLVFLAVKATQTAAAAQWLAALSGPETVVCVLQNGVEQLESVTPHCPRGRIVPAVVWFPAQAQSDGSVHLRGDARISLPDVAASRVVAKALQDTRCSVDLASNFKSLAWRKLLQNAVAGLMALTHRRSGMFGRPDISRLTLDYLRECLAVARAEGAELGDEVPQAILDKFQASPADMGTSILTDREAGRPLEWDIRNGVIARRGRAHGIPTPISDALAPLLAAASDGPG